jgi:hypothetical protein
VPHELEELARSAKDAHGSPSYTAAPTFVSEPNSVSFELLLVLQP